MRHNTSWVHISIKQTIWHYELSFALSDKPERGNEADIQHLSSLDARFSNRYDDNC